MTSYLITGTGRGIGLELTRQLAAHPASGLVFAATRSSVPSDALAAAISAAPADKIVHVECDVNDTSSVARAAEIVAAKLGSSRGLDVLVNNVGAVGEYVPGGVETLSTQGLVDIVGVNVGSAHEATKGFLGLLRKGKGKKVINISTSMGSMNLASRYAGSGLPAYFISKAAMNMLTIQYALDLGKEGFTVTAITPGWLKTDLGSQRADLTVDQGVTAVVNLLINRTGPEANGKFLNIHVPGWENNYPSNYDGNEVPW